MSPAKKKTVLVTGVGAIIGYGIVRCLRQCDTKCHIIGIDIFPDAVGQHWCDDFRQAPRTDSPEYFDFIRKLAEEFRIDLIIPGIEQDVSFWAEKIAEFQNTNTQVVLNPPELIFLSDDKWRTHQALTEGGFSSIPTAIEGVFNDISQQLGLPLLIKPRHSYASKGIKIIHDIDEFEYQRHKLGTNFMAQQIVGNDDDEYTCGVFGDGEGGMLAHINLRRKLGPEGSTSKATVVFNPDLSELLKQLTCFFKPKGPCNFQFRRHQNEFLLLEINPRVSSSTSIRKIFGYNEAQLCIDFYLNKIEIKQPPIQTGTVIRYIEDLLVP